MKIQSHKTKVFQDKKKYPPRDMLQEILTAQLADDFCSAGLVIGRQGILEGFLEMVAHRY